MFLGLGLALGFGSSVGFILLFMCFPTRQNLVNHEHPVVLNRDCAEPWYSIVLFYFLILRRMGNNNA